MKKIISLILMGCVLSGCTFFKPHKMDIEQGNIFTQADVDRLHIGMSQGEVRSIMGDPVTVNLLAANRLDYVYTFQAGNSERTQKRVSCIFQGGRLVEIQRAP